MEHVFKVASYTPNPTTDPDDVILAVIFGEYSELAYIRPTRDITWTRVTGLGITTFDDFVYYKGQFYALSYEGELVSFDVTNPSKSNMRLVLAEDSDKYYFVKRGFCYKKYRVKSYEGELLLVRRYLDRRFGDIDPVTKTFKVFKLSFVGPRWIEMKGFGDMALFVGDNASTSVSASNFSGCLKINCIYFTHDKNTIPIGDFGPCDLGVYNLETRRVALRFTIDDAAFPKMRGQAPIWVLPTYISD
ncbi:F-box protein At4g35733 [Morus notabilis]|uniref:F-box protein At4g35733 n=1 Tax=Morus notabilis TaxID=981085 RepID=UPI000CECE6E5|nr:F-box protein At4g35733 [Morus notabilis]